MCESGRKSLKIFHTGSLRRIPGIHWAETLPNAVLHKRTNSESLSQCVKNKRLGNVLRMKETRIPKRALQWTLQRRRKVGRPIVTTITKELIEMGMKWGEARVKAKDRLDWKSKVMTLCSTSKWHTIIWEHRVLYHVPLILMKGLGTLFLSAKKKTWKTRKGKTSLDDSLIMK
ncbi:endonuclease-reverse transcriptase [Brachionus plicatilis]|uniref:Endonuclease-reverse transcriptase n=1 Tax=Brachionus plicatilis TaxID=10195 RepID=A0A3M7QLZ3_BRAPC|nr:endonuclease-reverse transcriptase [Brachionus plicatilis]